MDQRTILAISLSFMLLMAYQIFMDTYYPPELIPQQIEEQVAVTDTPKIDTGPAPSTVEGIRVGKGAKGPVVQESSPIVATAAANKTSGKRYQFEDGAVRGEIAQVGGRIASLSFFKTSG